MLKRILYLSDYELRALEVKGKLLTEVQRFQMNQEGETQFTYYLRNDLKTPIYCIIESSQEDSQMAQIPHVLGKDHQNLLNHKMKRLFEDTAYTYGVVQGRETLGRRDDLVLFMALNNPKILQPWLNIITTNKVPLAGIYSVSLLTQLLLKYLPKTHNLLLVAHTPQISPHSSAGLRQGFFVQQKLHFSRLIPLSTLKPEEYADYVLKQILTTQRYLENEHLLVQTEQLRVVILTDTLLLNAIKTIAPTSDISTVNLHFIDNNQLIKKMKVRTNEEMLYLFHFIVFQMSQHWSLPNHYAKPPETRYFFYRKVRFALYLTSGLILSSAAIASWDIFEKTTDFKLRGQKNLELLEQRQIEIQQLRLKVPNWPAKIEVIQGVVDVGRQLKAYQPLSPQLLLEKISLVLNRHPRLFLERLEWGIGHSKTKIFQTHAKEIVTNYEDFDSDIAPPPHLQRKF
jgi:hypothetical protein